MAGVATETDPWVLDAELRRLANLRKRCDEPFGHVAMLMQMLGLWRDAGFASFGHYCSEALGMAERTVEQRIALERRLQVLPALRQAMRVGRISYEKARLIAWQADDATVEEFIGVAEAMTCIALRRRFEADEERQMCARGDFDFGLCAAHHLRGVHKGWIRVRGLAPHALEWELGERAQSRSKPMR